MQDVQPRVFCTLQWQSLHACGPFAFLQHTPRQVISFSHMSLQFLVSQASVCRWPQVVSPNIYNFDLWKTSGHADHYRDNMFGFVVEKQEYGLKPMNCPGHCVMFGSKARSYR